MRKFFVFSLLFVLTSVSYAQSVSSRIDSLMRAASGGDAEAQVELGKCYEDGDGVESDYDMAYSWYRKAADVGNAAGLNHVGRCFYNRIVA